MSSLRKVPGASLAIAVLLTLAATTFAAPAQAATTTSSIDCIADAGDSGQLGGAVGDTFTVNLANCAYMQPRNGTAVAVSTPSVTLALDVDMRFSSTLSGLGSSSTRVKVRTYPSTTDPVPTGQLLATNDFVLDSAAQQISVTDNTGVGQLDHLLGGLPGCNIAAGANGGSHAYSTMDITVNTAGDFTFRGLRSDPIGGYNSVPGIYDPLQDPFLALYRTFDPANPDAGVLGCNDDLTTVIFDQTNSIWNFSQRTDGTLIEAHQPYFAATALTPGFYTLVLMTYDPISSADLSAGSAAGFGSFPVRSRTTTFELWGPAGGLSLGHVSPSANGSAPLTSPAAAPELPSTGIDLQPALLAFVALLLGGTALLTARRRSRARS